MADVFLSANWHRVARSRLRLQVHAEVSRHRSRGQTWYAVRNAANGEMHRFSPAVYQFIGLLNGVRTVAEAWTIVADRLDEAAPTQDEVIRLLAQLHDADLLQSDDSPDFAELQERRRKRFRTRFWQHVGNPMALRLPLWDPDRFLTRALPVLAPLPARLTMLLWCAVVIPALVLAGVHWDVLTNGIDDRLFATENLLLMALVFPVVKALHEIGHAVAVKAGGGVVHEMGLMFLVLLPIPYVDASASGAFRSRWRRVGVGAAGMLVETFTAALAMDVWLLVEPGQLRAVAFAVMLVAGISTVMFNGNPLLRYDGYFILSDLLAIPNLSSRASRYFTWLTQKVLFGSKAPEPATADHERRWLLLYAPASYLCRLAVMAVIVLAIAHRFFVIGVLLAAWMVTMTIVWPIVRSLYAVMAGPGLAANRRRAVAVTMTGLAALTGFLLWVPVPLHTVGEGVVWLPEESLVRSGADGFVRLVAVQPGREVARGALLVVSADPDLAAEIAVDQAHVTALNAKYVSQEYADRVQAALTLRERDLEQSAWAQATARARDLALYSRIAGRFVVPRADDLPGRYHKRGEVLGYVLPDDIRAARVLVAQNDVDLVRKRLLGLQVRVAADPTRSFPARLLREVPAASDELPSKALAIEGGGSAASDPRDKDHPRTLSRFFQFDIEIPPEAAYAAAGGHLWVRFDHGREPVAAQVWRRVRQLLLSRFDA